MDKDRIEDIAAQLKSNVKERKEAADTRQKACMIALKRS
jgi:hypothetical protein